MTHQIENMFSVRDIPWHRLGTILPDAPSISDALRLAGLDWKVGLKPLFTGEGVAVEANATYRQDNNRILGVVGPRWTPLQNDEALNIFQPLVESGDLSLETAGSLKDGEKVWILARINTVAEAGVAGSDTVIPYVLLSNHHGGKAAVRYGLTPVRVVCANTLAAAVSSEASQLIRVSHSKNVVANVENLRDTMNLAKREFETTLENYRYLASRPINSIDLEKYVRVVFGLHKEDSKRASLPKAVEEALTLFEKELTDNTAGSNWWNAYNAVQGVMQWKQGRTEESRLDNIWFGPNAGRNRFALDSAVAMAG